MFEFKFFRNMQYIVKYPKNYRAGEKYPTILLLHGSGSRGTDARRLCKNDFFTVTEYMESFDFVTLAPMCHEDTWFDLWETLRAFALEIPDFEFCDAKRIYAMGPSMGGYATWQLGMSLPWLFAAIVPICGGGMYWNAERLKNVPVWAFHGEKDTLVLPEESEKMVAAVNAAGGSARLSLYPDVCHEVWLDVYSDAEVFAWLLSNAKK